MAITSNSYTDSLINGIDVLPRNYQSGVSAKSTSELYKSYNNNYTNKNDDFKSILNSTNVSKEKDSAKVDETNSNQASNEVKDSDTLNDTKDTTNIDELNEKLKKLEDESKSDSKDKITDILEELLNLFAQFGIKEDDLKSNGKINQEFLNTLIEKINKQEGSINSPNSIMQKIMELLKNDSMKENLDTNSLKTINNILVNLSNKIADNKSESSDELKNGIKNLMSEVSNMLDTKQNQANKVLTLENMLNKNYSQDSSEGSTGDDATASKDNKELSKEDKFLNSLIDDKKDDSLSKINLFASRVATTQNQGVNAARGLTINKATFVDDLIKDVKFMSTNSLKELTVKVNPGNLGEITIKLVQEDGLMKANLKANSKETTALLSQSLADIKKQLNDQSIKVSDVNIELYQDDTTFFKEQGFERQFAGEQNNQNGSPKGSISTNQSIASEDLIENLAEENNNVNFFA